MIKPLNQIYIKCLISQGFKKIIKQIDKLEDK